MEGADLVAPTRPNSKRALLTRLTAGLIFVRQSTTGTAMKSTTYLEVKDENGQGYVICVTEFQKRGLPHAHIAYRPADSPAKKKTTRRRKGLVGGQSRVRTASER